MTVTSCFIVLVEPVFGYQDYLIEYCEDIFQPLSRLSAYLIITWGKILNIGKNPKSEEIAFISYFLG